MDKQLLREVLQDQNEIRLENTVPRELLAEIRNYHQDPQAIIISGVRRCGKSTLLAQLRQENDGHYVNFDDERLIRFKIEDFQMLTNLLTELFGAKNTYYFDEIQNIAGWERFARRLIDAGKKLYMTGSNASMLSRELGTHLTGRHLRFNLYPFSFREYLRFKKTGALYRTSEQRALLTRQLRLYLQEGGFPEYLQNRKQEYLKILYENILFRDIITRHGLTGGQQLQEVALIGQSSIGKKISFNSIKKTVGLSSATTVKEYLQYMENSYLLFLLPKYDPSLKKQAYANKKIYTVDPGLARAVGFRPTEDSGRFLENTVFLELLRRGHEAYYHENGNECDFVIRKGRDIIQVIQVTQTPDAQREIPGMKEAMRKYHAEGLILSLDEKRDLENVKVIPVWEWLLGH